MYIEVLEENTLKYLGEREREKVSFSPCWLLVLWILTRYIYSPYFWSTFIYKLPWSNVGRRSIPGTYNSKFVTNYGSPFGFESLSTDQFSFEENFLISSFSLLETE